MSSTAYVCGICGSKNNGTVENCNAIFTGTGFSYTGVDNFYYYSICSSNDGINPQNCTYKKIDFDKKINATNGAVSAVSVARKTPVYVYSDSKFIGIKWIYGKEPFSLNSIYEPTKFGYTLVGWKYNDITYGVADLIYPNDENEIVVDAIFAPNITNLILDSNNGLNQNQQYEVNTDESINLTNLEVEMSNPYGYHFAGWSNTSDGDVCYGKTDNYVSNGNDATLYAIWNPNINNIVFNSNGGTGQMDNQSIHTDEEVTLTSCEFTAPSGYYFAGWALSPNGEIQYYDCSNISSNGLSVINLYAVWKEI